MRHLPKHLRPKWRYLAVGIESWPEADLSRRAFQRRLWYAGQNLLGDPGCADADLSVFAFHHDEGVGEAVVRTRRETVGEARAALACLDKIEGQEVGIAVRGVSGTVRGCEEKYLGRRPEVSGEKRVVFENADRAAVTRDGLVDVRVGDAYTGATDFDVTPV
ncbi:Rpp14/Pop5 family protein [Halalkalicoccus jeotgali]|uniref:Ribonuclease P protein component 2 n=1 Tax=Halalkalicoccus jeotgali (strain DSM 18796 / CECT 7217 / JCM 14584 / KCTC 4019 / B3) TaxID=795797 RepID=D8J3E6_HALJB|nr:Rpp14/Pop5 family protein [Halalkalicoccus jeotgali]ADJ15253.1 Ribonuclease P-related protein [Halalkalicoccus jeotgali B3]ELY35326.1 Ribonuclease P-like protein [Halalkalicoccus jeotgali B3]